MAINYWLGLFSNSRNTFFYPAEVCLVRNLLPHNPDFDRRSLLKTSWKRRNAGNQDFHVFPQYLLQLINKISVSEPQSLIPL